MSNQSDCRQLLECDFIAALEDEIAKRSNSCINREFMEFAAESAAEELAIAELSTKEVEQYLQSNAKRVVEFGARLLEHPESQSDEEEYPAGEELDDDEKSVTLSEHGYCAGITVTDAIYLMLLDGQDRSALLAFLKKRRIPHAPRFARALHEVYSALGQQ